MARTNKKTTPGLFNWLEEEESMPEWDYSRDGYPPGYFGEPNEGFFSGLFTQPLFFGADAVASGGWSSDYPRYRNAIDEWAQQFPAPEKEDYYVTDDYGNVFFDEDSWHNALSLRTSEYPYL